MNTKIVMILLSLLFAVGIAAADVAQYDASVTLENKDTTTWEVLTEDGTSATVQYNESGEEFTYSIEATGLEGNECYYLIYYADRPDRFNETQWGGDNPGAYIDDFSTTACGEILYTEGSTELNMNLPHPNDWNIDPDPDYCDENNGFDNYDNCCGAKLWLVTCDDYEDGTVINWGNAGMWLFETDLIWYNDDGVNWGPSVLDAGNYGHINAGETATVWVEVRDYDGITDINNVTADFSDHGVTELVDMSFIEMLNCNTIALYEGSTTITQSTCWCDEDGEDDCEEVRVDIVATDTADEQDGNCTDFTVYPGDCDHMVLHNMECDDTNVYDEALRTVALTQCYACNLRDYTNWWGHGYMYDVYQIRYVVQMYDEYNNCIDDIDNAECCYDFTATVTGTDASLKFDSGNDDAVIIVNENNPGTTMLTVHCNGGDNIASITQEVEFLMPVCSLIVTSNTNELMSCDGESLIDIDAQIVDYLGNPILMPRVEVTLYVGPNEPRIVKTDEFGIASFFDVEVNTYEAGETADFRAEAECREGSLSIDIVEGPTYLEVGIDADYMVAHGECGAPDSTVATVQLLSGCEEPFTQDGVAIDIKVLYDDDDCRNGESTRYETDDNGMVTFDLAGTETPCEITLCVKMVTCDIRGMAEIEVVEPIMDALMFAPVIPIMYPFEPGMVQMTNTIGWNTSREMAMCPPNGTYDYTVEDELIIGLEHATIDYTYDGCDRRILNNGTALAVGTTNVTVTCGYLTSGDITVEVTRPIPDPTPARRSGSSGGGTYPLPDQNDGNTTGTNNTTQVDPAPEPDPKPTVKATAKLPAAPGSAPKPEPEPEPTEADLPGFGILTEIGVMIVAYFVIRRRD